MPSYYVAKKKVCKLCSGPDCSLNDIINQKVEWVSSSEQTQFNTSKTVFGMYNILTSQDKAKGNTIKQGSGGNSSASYMARKKGGLQQYCNCANL
jgi:hypothetical protein